MKGWKKGGLILLGLDILFWLIWFLYSYIYIVVLDRGSDISGLALIAIPYYGAISLIPAFIVGAIIGALSEKAFKIEKKIITNWAKIGFLIGIFWPIWVSVYRTLGSSVSFFDVLSDFFRSFFREFFTILILSIIIVIVSGWVFWVIGAMVKRK